MHLAGLFYLKIYGQLTHTNAPAAASMHHVGVAVHPHYCMVGCVFWTLWHVVEDGGTLHQRYTVSYAVYWSMGPAPAGRALHTGAGCVSVPSYVWYRARQGAPSPGCMPALVTFLYPGMLAVVEATPTPVPVSNPYGELGSKRGRPKGSTNKATARKPGPNARTLATIKATSASRKITSMFERSSAEAGSSSSSALPPSTNGPVPRLRGSTYSSSSSRTGDREGGRSSGSGSARPNGAPQSSTSLGTEFLGEAYVAHNI